MQSTATIATESAKIARRDTLKTWATLAGLGLVAPFNLAVVLPCWLLSLPLRPRSPEDVKTVLISGGKMTKAGAIARAFHRAGHRVILGATERYRYTGHRFSRAVDHFTILPDPTDPGYADALAQIVADHSVDLYVPVCSPVASYHDAVAGEALKGLCETVHLTPTQIIAVDDKFQFAQAAQANGLAAPKSIRITDPQQVLDYDFADETRPFILKSIAYDPVRRMDLTKFPMESRTAMEAHVRSLPISESNPWVLQEFIRGREYCTHGTVRDGQLTVHICCESSPFQINYDHIDHPEIRDWVERFVAGTSYTGQISLDFIQAEDTGAVYAIECNPRTHSAITLFNNQPGLPAAYLADRDTPLEPTPGARPTYWLYHEIIRLIRSLSPKSEMRVSERLKIIAQGRDAVFDWRDPWPFFMLHHVHIPSLLWRDLREGRGWTKIDFNIGKLVQAGGD